MILFFYLFVTYFFRAPPMCLLPNAHYEQVMAAFGGNGYFVQTREELQESLRKSLADTTKPSLINIMIEPQSMRKAQVNVTARTPCYSEFFLNYLWAWRFLLLVQLIFVEICIRRVKRIAWWANPASASPHGASSTSGKRDCPVTSWLIALWQSEAISLKERNSVLNNHTTKESNLYGDHREGFSEEVMLKLRSKR